MFCYKIVNYNVFVLINNKQHPFQDAALQLFISKTYSLMNFDE